MDCVAFTWHQLDGQHRSKSIYQELVVITELCQAYRAERMLANIAIYGANIAVCLSSLVRPSDSYAHYIARHSPRRVALPISQHRSTPKFEGLRGAQNHDYDRHVSFACVLPWNVRGGGSVRFGLELI